MRKRLCVKLKERLAAGGPVLGLFIVFDAPAIVEMAGALGFDWVLLDCKHGALSIDRLEPLITAAEASGVAPIMRPPDHGRQRFSARSTAVRSACKCARDECGRGTRDRKGGKISSRG